MSALVFTIHSKNPERRKLQKVCEVLYEGGVIIYPTDTGFTLGCALANKDAIQKIRQIRKIPEEKALTFLCKDLSNISEFAKVSNLAYKAIKKLIPGPYTFILPASKEVPRYAQDPKRKTAGIRVPDHILSQALLEELGSPIISISAKIEGFEYTHPEELLEKFLNLVDVAVKTDEYNFLGESTVIDMTTDEFKLIRRGAGFNKVMEVLEISE
ncbi:threonylcarbamoyl-AMP synthase [Bacteroidetes/Chlorobi group bacterium Naka2016]|jgi:tRNA threonylcarbamoyl adenosine modification protein (Sua5/YciO/YrdC/YwlC family)|nr:MAG: threonylcarbamoyl-AMP synthase [Bacteroidetes/Chlorobi group bacterium Naka2016]